MFVERIAMIGLVAAAEAAGISVRTARKWHMRFKQFGLAGLLDRSSRPHTTRSTVDVTLCRRIMQLRRARTPMRTIAAIVGRSVATISRVLAQQGLSSLKALEPALPVLRYERDAPGELLHIDSKKLGRIVRPSHRVTGNRRDSVDGAGWEFAHVAIGDHSRASFVQRYADERKDSAVPFLKADVAHYAALGVKIKRLLTDISPAYRSRFSPGHARPWASSTPSHGPIGRKPTARPIASFKPACANGLMAGPGTTVRSALPGYRHFWLTTTREGLTRLSAINLIKTNMPLGQGNSLSDEQAWNVTKYMTSQAQPANLRLGKS